MFQIPGTSRFLDLTGSIRLYYVLAAGIFFSILTFILYKDFFITITMAACTFVVYYLLSRPPKQIQVIVGEDNLIIDETVVPWDACLAWAVVDLGDTLEFVIRTTNMSHQFYYFYVDEARPEVKRLILLLNEFMPYDETIPAQNPLHSTLRMWGLK